MLKAVEQQEGKLGCYDRKTAILPWTLYLKILLCETEITFHFI